MKTCPIMSYEARAILSIVQSVKKDMLTILVNFLIVPVISYRSYAILELRNKKPRSNRWTRLNFSTRIPTEGNGRLIFSSQVDISLSCTKFQAGVPRR